ncbi:MAG: glycosyltransferase family 4 protein [Clostridia bacterium]|nr:glycosyltransferase family 4 protein [Clostridia bacterium]
MNILFLSIGRLSNLSVHGIYTDLLREFRDNGHNVYVMCPTERKEGKPTSFGVEEGINVLRVKIGNIKKCNIIEKGISTVLIEPQFKAAIKKYYSSVKFDLVMYSTPPITFANVIDFVKKRDGAASYLILKDIFPQNAVDMGMFKKNSIINKFFRRKEKKLYAISDKIGCMSKANVEYIIKHNPQVNPENVEVCPNSITVRQMNISEEQILATKQAYGIPTDKKIFVYGGNLGKPQGIDFFIKAIDAAASEIEDVFFLISGSGTEFSKIERYINQTDKTNIKLMRSIPREEYEAMIAGCDVGMIFLDNRFTIPNFPSRLISYLQTSLPVLAVTDVNSDIGTVATEGNFGWWCQSNDVEQFVKTVKEILSADTKAMGKIGYEYLCNNYTSKISYDIIMSHFTQKQTVTK